MYNNQNDYQNIFRYGRCVIILIGCWLGWFIYKFGAQLYGKAGGLLALFLYILNPNIIAHSGLTTIDIGTSCFIFISIYYYWKFFKKKDLPAAILSGVFLGFAELSNSRPFYFIRYSLLSYSY
jgi:4-amino-4-deoxy-L-arabinose transferase-like glycosyltransferase